MRRAAFFDMDNTLLSVDSGMSWTRFLYKRGELPPAMVAKALYWSTLYKLAVLDMEGVVVPEPTSLALLGIGAIGLLGRRRRSN